MGLDKLQKYGTIILTHISVKKDLKNVLMNTLRL